jgi:hypothetical protein
VLNTSPASLWMSSLGKKVEMRRVKGELRREVGHAHADVAELVDGRGRFLEALELPGRPLFVLRVVEPETHRVAVGQLVVVVAVAAAAAAAASLFVGPCLGRPQFLAEDEMKGEAVDGGRGR